MYSRLDFSALDVALKNEFLVFRRRVLHGVRLAVAFEELRLVGGKGSRSTRVNIAHGFSEIDSTLQRDHGR